MATITNTVTSPTQAANDSVFNPNSQLDKDAFMQLFLKELQMQDPTDPMDTEKMLEQTAYMGTMEMNMNMQKTLDSLSATLAQTQEVGAISAIGKIGDTGNRYINVTDEDMKQNFELYFGDDISSGNVVIKDKVGNIIKSFPLEASTKGIKQFEWDLTDDNGKRVENGTYEVSAEYTSPDGSTHTAALGAYPIESIRKEDGEIYAKLGSQYLPFDAIKEIYEWQG
ncbi:MAG: flagellar hook capping protein [Epsilonproteobacteria bacterium]|nr:flagellar hook capping protein [Campylobacterota bacterium]